MMTRVFNKNNKRMVLFILKQCKTLTSESGFCGGIAFSLFLGILGS